MPKYTLSVAMIVRDEEAYLPEHIEFHLLQGVEHFYIVEHERLSDKLEKILKTYIDEGLVTYKTCLGDRPQLKVYDCILRDYGHESEWMAFIDADEFLFAPGFKLIGEDGGFTDMPSHFGAYAVNWSLFGSNGHVYKTPGLVIERFTARAPQLNPHVKSIVRPKLVMSVGRNPHCFYLKQGALAITGWIGDPVVLPRNYALVHNAIGGPFTLHHYHTKSLLEYKKKKLNPRADSGELYPLDRIEEMFRVHDCNDVQDISAAVFAPQVIQALKNRGLWNG